MKESYPDDIMLCFVQGFGNTVNNDINKDKIVAGSSESAAHKSYTKKEFEKPVSIEENSELLLQEDSKSRLVFIRKSLRLSSRDKALKSLPESKKSIGDLFANPSDSNGKRPKSFLALKKNWSTGNFSANAAGGGGGAPRSAPATPLQIEPHPRPGKQDKHAKSLSALSVQRTSPASATAAGDTVEVKQPYKARQKKFLRHFPQVGPEERVVNYYSCALVGDLLLQGHLYITKNYFAFYSNVFGYVTKLLIPTTSVIRITKEKVARIIPNAVGVCTRDERHVFGSLLSRDSTYKLMVQVWKAAKVPELAPETQGESNASEVSVEDDSSSGGVDQTDAPAIRRAPEAVIATAGAAVIQPTLLAGGGSSSSAAARWWGPVLSLIAVLLTLSALVLTYKLFRLPASPMDSLDDLSGEEVYTELVKWRAQLHGRAASELHNFLSTNLLLLSKVRESLETLSGVILSEIGQDGGPHIDIEAINDTILS